MKTIIAKSSRSSRSLPARSRAGAVERQIQALKDNVFQVHRTQNRCNDHLLRLALNEAEALAWQAGFPELLFPLLAIEKVQAIAAWKARQKSVQKNSAEFAFAA